METPAESPSKFLATSPIKLQSLRRATFEYLKPNWLWKSARSVFPFIRRQKLDCNSTMDSDDVDGDAVGGDAVSSDFMGGGVRIAG